MRKTVSSLLVCLSLLVVAQASEAPVGLASSRATTNEGSAVIFAWAKWTFD